jgi:hypothetical protein
LPLLFDPRCSPFIQILVDLVMFVGVFSCNMRKIRK